MSRTEDATVHPQRISNLTLWTQLLEYKPSSCQSVSVGLRGNHICGIRLDSSAICWGRNDRGQSLPQSGSFISVSTGSEHTCRVLNDNSVDCWGSNNAYIRPGYTNTGQASPPTWPILISQCRSRTQLRNIGRQYHNLTGKQSDLGRYLYGTIRRPFWQVSVS